MPIEQVQNPPYCEMLWSARLFPIAQACGESVRRDRLTQKPKRHSLSGNEEGFCRLPIRIGPRRVGPGHGNCRPEGRLFSRTIFMRLRPKPYLAFSSGIPTPVSCIDLRWSYRQGLCRQAAGAESARRSALPYLRCFKGGESRPPGPFLGAKFSCHSRLLAWRAAGSTAWT